MCCGNKRTSQYGACGRRGMRFQSRQSDGGIMAIMTALNNIKLAGHGIDSTTQAGCLSSQQPAVPDYHFAAVERGVVSDFEKDEKALATETVAFEVLPTYEDTTGIPTQPRAGGPQLYTPEAAQQQPQQDPQTKLLGSLEVFRVSLLEYQHGVRGAKKDAKRAAKNVVRELWYQEVETRRAQKGSLECGERKSIKREIKPVKQMLKSAVWEAKAERKGRI